MLLSTTGDQALVAVSSSTAVKHNASDGYTTSVNEVLCEAFEQARSMEHSIVRQLRSVVKTVSYYCKHSHECNKCTLILISLL